MTLTLQETTKRQAMFKAFLIALITSFAFFLPFIIYDHGYFLFVGDFNVQQIPFYSLAHDAVKSGNIFWSFTTDLGANFIGSYSFYLLFSPFFWLTLPFPNWMVPYLMAPLLMLKFAVSRHDRRGVYRAFCKNQNYAVLGGLCMRFGFSVYNIFFNHFNDVIAFFPAYAYCPGRAYGKQPPRLFWLYGGVYGGAQLLFLCWAGGVCHIVFCGARPFRRLENDHQKVFVAVLRVGLRRFAGRRGAAALGNGHTGQPPHQQLA